MGHFFSIHAVNPQERLISKTVDLLLKRKLMIYPTDSAYHIGCLLSDTGSIERMRNLCRLTRKDPITLMCSDLSQLSQYVSIDNSIYRLLKSIGSHPFSFILPSKKKAPKQLIYNNKHKIIARIVEYPFVKKLLMMLPEPMVSRTLYMPDDVVPVSDIESVKKVFENKVDIIVHSGCCGVETETIVDMTGVTPEVFFKGKGDVSLFL